MKTYLTIILLLSVATLLGDESINEQIEAIKNSSPQERVIRMNRLKVQIATMNEDDRSAALETLQSNQTEMRVNPQNHLKYGNKNKEAGTIQQHRIHQNDINHPKQQGR